MITISIPIPPRVISPNGRPRHWSVAAKAKKAAKAAAKLRTLMVLDGKPADPVNCYTLNYYWPTATRRDDDNAVASAKASMDGICEALWMDDRDLSLRWVFHAKDKANPRLVVNLFFEVNAIAQTPPDSGTKDHE